MATCFGWTWEYVDEFVTVPRLKEIAQYQKAHPPLHIMAHSYLGGAKGSAAQTTTPGDGPNAPTKVTEGFLAEIATFGTDMSPLGV